MVAMVYATNATIRRRLRPTNSILGRIMKAVLLSACVFLCIFLKRLKNSYKRLKSVFFNVCTASSRGSHVKSFLKGISPSYWSNKTIPKQ